MIAAGAAAALLLPAAGPRPCAADEEDAAAAPPVWQQVAERQLTELTSREGPAAPLALLTRNLSRYFALYLVPSDRDELSRLLGTLERILDEALGELHLAASSIAVRQEADAVAPEHVATALDRLLPASPTEWNEAAFFPLAPLADRVVIESVDLQAFADTGLVWQRLLAYAPPAEGPELLPLAPEAVEVLAGGVNAYGLVLLRLAGAAARDELAHRLGSHHLRDAAKQIAACAVAHAGGAGVGEEEPLEAAPGRLFRDVTGGAGIRFRHVTTPWLSTFRRYGPEAPTFSGGGVAAGDVDGDGWDDLVFCGGQGCALYRNRRDGTFEDVTERAGIGVPGEARMPLLADLDNDGDRDLFVTYAAEGNRLFANLGGGRFEDVTAEAGVAREGDISGPAAAVDVDGDGLLDLYVGNFGDYLAGELPISPSDSVNGQPNRLFRNQGGLRFAERPDAGVGDTGWAQALSHADLDLDGDQDLYVANDFGRNALLDNLGDGTFRSVTDAADADDRFHGMNVAFADLNRDRLPDILVTNIWFWHAVRREVTETNSLLLSERRDGGGVSYRRSADPELLGEDTGWAWGAVFFDVEHDGDDDLLVANGFTDYFTFVQHRPAPDDPDRFYPINNGRDPNHLFRNDGDIPDQHVEDSGIELPGVNSRAVALLDFDHDGDLDAVVSTFHSWAHLFRNDAAAPEGRWLQVELVGDPTEGVSRDAFGAQIVARSGELEVWRASTGGGSYLSQSSSRLHFGLGDAETVDLEILWPGGELQEVPGVETGRIIRVRQGREGFELVTPGAP